MLQGEGDEFLRMCGIETPDTRYFSLPGGSAAFASKRSDRQDGLRVPMQSLAAFTGANYRTPGVLDYVSFFRATQMCTNDVTFCEGPGGYHQMDVMGEALAISRAQMLRLANEAEVPQGFAGKMIDRICDVASQFAILADDLYPQLITRGTLRTIQHCIDQNVARLRQDQPGRGRR